MQSSEHGAPQAVPQQQSCVNVLLFCRGAVQWTSDAVLGPTVRESCIAIDDFPLP